MANGGPLLFGSIGRCGPLIRMAAMRLAGIKAIGHPKQECPAARFGLRARHCTPAADLGLLSEGLGRPGTVSFHDTSSRFTAWPSGPPRAGRQVSRASRARSGCGRRPVRGAPRHGRSNSRR